MKDQLYTIQEVASILKVSSKTLRRWEQAGIIKTIRTAGNQRRYRLEDIRKLQRRRNLQQVKKDILEKIDQPLAEAKPMPITTPQIIEPLVVLQEEPQQISTEMKPIINNPKDSIFRMKDLSLWMVSSVTALVLLFGGLLFWQHEQVLSVDGKNTTKQDLQASQKSVLAAETSQPAYQLSINVPGVFGKPVTFLDSVAIKKGLTVNKVATLSGGIVTNNANINAGNGKIIASNVIYSIQAGANISISGNKQNPTISANVNGGVTSLEGASGAVNLTQGSGISLNGLEIANSGVLSVGGQTGDVSLSAGNGVSISGTTITNSDTGSAQNIFKTFSINGTDITASNNNDTVNFAAGSGISLTGDVGSKTITITSNASGTLAGLTTNGVLYATSSTNATSTNPGITGTVLHGVTNGAPVFSALDLTADVTGILPYGNGGTGINTTPTNGEILIGNASGYSLGTLTQGSGIGVANGSGTITLTNSGVLSLTGTTNQVLVNAGTVSQTGAVTLTLPQDIGTASTPTFASATLSSNTNELTLGNGNTGTITLAALSGNRTYTFPDDSGTVCLQGVNCGGGGGGDISGSGDQYYIPVFASGGTTIGDSDIYDNGKVAIGTTSPQGLFSVSGAVPGLALVNLNVTNEQNILTASASGITEFTLDNDGDLQFAGGSGFLQTLTSTAANGKTYNFPTFTGSTADICLSTGNCSGLGGIIGGSGSLNYIPKFTPDGEHIADSLLYDNGTSVGVNTSTPTGLFDVSGAIAGQALAVLNYTGSDQNILTGSASGSTKFVFDSSGDLNLTDNYEIGGIDVLNSTTLGSNIVNSSLTGLGTVTSGFWHANAIGTQYGGTGQDFSLVTQGSMLYFSGNGVMGTFAPGSAGQLLESNGTSAPSWVSTSSVNFWQQANGALSPLNITNDLLLGGTATSSAVFAFTGFALPSHQTQASISGNLIVMPNNGYGGNVGIGTTTPGAKLEVNGSTLVANNNGYYAKNSSGSQEILAYLDNLNQVSLGYTGSASTYINSGGTDYFQIGAGTYTAVLNTNGLSINNGSSGPGSGNGLIVGSGNVGFGTTSPVAPLQVNGSYGSNAAAIINQVNSFGDILDASQSGNLKFSIQNDGTITSGKYTTNNGLLYTNGSGVVQQLAAGSGGECLTAGSGGAFNWSTCAAGINLWEENSGALSPTNINDDLLLGSTATTSAKFAFEGVNSTNPIASISASTGSTYLTGAGVLGTTNAQTLQIGSATTGQVAIGLTPAAPFGNTRIGTGGSSDNGLVTAQQFTTSAGVGGTVNSMSVYVHNGVTGGSKIQMAIYSDTTSGCGLSATHCPNSLIASTAQVTPANNSWNTIAINATLSSSTTYWLAYWTSDTTQSDEALVHPSNAGNYFVFGSATFGGSMPSTFPTITFNDNTYDASIYASFSGNSGSAMTIDPNLGTIDLGYNESLYFSGPSSYISNTQGYSNSEVYGASAQTSGQNTVVLGSLANASDNNAIAIGYAASSVLNGVTLGYGAQSIGSGGGIAIGYSAGANTEGIAIGQSADAANAYSMAMGYGSTTNASNQLVIGGPQSNSSYISDSYFGSGVTDASPQSTTIHATGGSGSNIAGASLSLAGGAATGNALGGSILFKTSTAGSSGSTLQSLSTRMSIDNSGNVSINNLTTNGGVVYTNGSGTLTQTGTSSSTQCLLGGTTPSWGTCVLGQNYLQLNSGAISPFSTTADLLIGGTATTSAKFAFINNAAGTPTASISGNLSLAVPTGANPAATFNILNGGTLGYYTSPGGNAGLSANPALYIANNGSVGVGTSNPQGLFNVQAPAGSDAINLTTSTNSPSDYLGIQFNNRAEIGYDGNATSPSAFIRGGSGKGVVIEVNSEVTNVPFFIDQYHNIMLGDSAVANERANGILPLALLTVGGSASISGQLSLYGTPQIQSTASQTLTLGGSTTGDIAFQPGGQAVGNSLYLASNGNVGIGLTNPSNTFAIETPTQNAIVNLYGQGAAVDYGVLQVTSAGGSIPAGNPRNLAIQPNGGFVGIGYNSSTAFGNAELTVNQPNAGGDIFSASQSGTAKFVINNNGNIQFTGNSGFLNTLTSAATAARTYTLPDASGTLCLQSSASCGFALGTNYWQMPNSGAIAPFSTTADLLLGGTATASADFAFTGVDSTTPIASISAFTNSGNKNGLSLNASLSTIQALNLNTLTLGGNTTGNILLSPNSGNGIVGIGNVIKDDGNGAGGSNGISLLSLSDTTSNAFSKLIINGPSSNGGDAIEFMGNGQTYGDISYNIANSELDIDNRKTGPITFQNWDGVSEQEWMRIASNGDIGINSTSPLATLDVRPNILSGGTVAIASISGKTSFAGLMVDNSGSGDLFTASKSGATKFVIQNNGNIEFAGTSNFLNTIATAATAARTYTLPDASGTLCLQSSASCGFALGTNYWQMPNNGAIAPFSTTADLLLGGTATTSAKFAFEGIDTTTPTASIGGNLSIAVPTGANPAATFNILNGGTLNFQTSPGGDAGLTTALFISAKNGDIGIGSSLATNPDKLYIAGNEAIGTGYSGNAAPSNGLIVQGNTGIGTNSPLATLDVRANSGTLAIASISGKTSFAGLVVDNSGTGDLFTASSSGLTRFVVTQNGNVGIGNAAPSNPLDVYSTGEAIMRLQGVGDAYNYAGIVLSTTGTTKTWNILNRSLTGQANNFDIQEFNGTTTSDRFTIMPGGNVGIGTTAPNALLQVTGTASISGQLTLYGTPTLQATANQTLTLGGASTGNIAFNPDNVGVGNSLYLASNGQVGIGTTTPASGDSLDVEGGNIAFGYGYGLQATGHTYANVLTTGWDGSDDFTSLYAPGGNPADANPILTLLEGGNVGIGTTNPGATLDIAASIPGVRLSGQNPYFNFNNTDSGAVTSTLTQFDNRLELALDPGNYFGLSSSVGGTDNIWMDPLYGSGFTGNVATGYDDASEVQVSGTITDPNYYQDGIFANTIINPSSISTQQYTGIKSWASIGNGNLSGGTIDSIIAGGGMYGTSGQTLDNFFGLQLNYEAGNNTTTNNWVGIENQQPWIDTGASVINATGYYSDEVTEGTNSNVTLQIGEGPASGNYAIYDDSGFQNYFGGSLGIGTTSPLATLDVRGNIATTPTASVSGATTFAEAVVDQSGTGDIFTASKSGATKFTIKNSGVVVIGNNTNGITFDPTFSTDCSGQSFAAVYCGSARPTKQITLAAEYPGAVLIASPSAGTNINGFMTASASMSATPTNNDNETYYQWASTQIGTLNQYTIALTLTLPSDFSGWATSGNVMTIDFNTGLTTSADNALDVYMYQRGDTSGVPVYFSTNNTSSTAKTWKQIQITGAQLSGAKTWNSAGAQVTLYLTLKAMNSTANYVQVGDIKYSYLSGF